MLVAMSLRVISAETEDFRARVVIPLPARHHGVVGPGPRPAIDIVIPVRNAERDLARSVHRLHTYLVEDFPFSTRITIADRASTDGTFAAAWRLAGELPTVRVLHLSEASRGRALAAAWLTSDARVVLDVDLDPALNLPDLLPLVAPVISGRSEISVGGGRASVSRARDLVLKLARVRRHLTAVRADVARRLLTEVLSRDRLFDAELLLRAQLAGLRIHELPAN